MADIEGRVTYHRSRVEGGTELSPRLTPGRLRSVSFQGRAYYSPGKKVVGGRKGCIRSIPASRGSIFETGCFMTPVSLLQVYFVLNYWTSQGIYLRRAAFLQRLILIRLSSLHNYKFLPPTFPKILIEPCHEAGGGGLTNTETTNPRGTRKPDNPLKVIQNLIPLKRIRDLVQNVTQSQWQRSLTMQT